MLLFKTVVIGNFLIIKLFKTTIYFVWNQILQVEISMLKTK